MATHCPFLFLLLLLLWGRACCRPQHPPRPSHLPRELTWEAWLLLDTLSPTAARRITPKSVFIAPTFSAASLPACAEGYRTDSMGRCVKIVRVNQEAQLDFLLRRLNAMYAKPDQQPPPKTQTEGPLQVSIPIAVTDPLSNEENTDETNSVEMTAILADVINDKNDKNSSKMPQTILAVWNISSNTSSPGHVFSNRSVPSNSSQSNITTNSSYPQFSEENSYTVTDDSELQDSSSSSHSEVQEETIPNVMLTAPSTVLVQEIEPLSSPSSVSVKNHEVKNIPEKKESSSDSFGPSNQSSSDDSEFIENNHDTSTESCEHICGEDESKSATETITEVAQMSKETTTAIQSVNKNITDMPKIDIFDLEKENSVFSESTYWEKPKVRHTTTVPEVSMVRDRKPGNVRFPTHEYNHEISTFKNKNQYDSTNSVRFPDDNLKERQQVVFPNEERERQPFWWLPPGWTLDETRHHPVLLKFWARAPLSRYFSSTEHPRQHHRRKHTHYNPHYSSEYGKK